MHSGGPPLLSFGWGRQAVLRSFGGIFLFPLCSHFVLTRFPMMLPKCPCVSQTVPNATTFYPIFFAQICTIVNHIAIQGMAILGGFYFGSIFLGSSPIKRAHNQKQNFGKRSKRKVETFSNPIIYTSNILEPMV